jgi:two-component system, LytTR family, sensor kinase
VLERPAWKRTLLPITLWSSLVLFFLTTTEIPYDVRWVHLTWTQSVTMAMLRLLSWVSFAFVIIWVDRNLPIPEDSLVIRLLIHAPLSVIPTVALAYVDYEIMVFANVPHGPAMFAGGLLPTTWRVIHTNRAFFYWAAVGTNIAFDYQKRLRDRLIRTAELERLLSEARLHVLCSQLRPHFLFNTLNAASAHVGTDPERARLILERLGKLLRRTLDDIDQQEVPLRHELAFIEEYLQLEAMRFEDRLTVSVSVDPVVLDAMVPPFILQPLVENAVRHGACARLSHGTVAVNAWSVDGRLRLAVLDNGPGLPAGWSPERHQGIGIRNTRERLRYLYAENHTFQIEPASGGGVRVDLDLPFRPS